MPRPSVIVDIFYAALTLVPRQALSESTKRIEQVCEIVDSPSRYDHKRLAAIRKRKGIPLLSALAV